MSDQNPAPPPAHTPGPWTWFDYSGDRKLLSSPSRAVIHCPDAPMAVSPEDMALIARAPTLLEERDRLRAVLVALVGVDGKEELEQFEVVMRVLPAPGQDRAVIVDAIHALIATLPEQEA